MLSRLIGLLAALVLSCPALAANPRVEIKTNLGAIVLELDADKAPKTVENFLAYVRSGFYAGTIFHRVIDGFMIQGGGMNEQMQEKETRAAIQNEAANGLKNTLGTVAMARTPNPHSARAQFFINIADNAFLDYPGRDGWGYAVFGKVVDGLSVVQQIAKVQTGNAGGHQNVPLKPVVIEAVAVLGEKPGEKAADKATKSDKTSTEKK